MKLIDIIIENSLDLDENAALKRLFQGLTKNLSKLTLKDLKTIHPVFAKDLQKVFTSRSIDGITKIDDLVMGISKGTLSSKGYGDLITGILKTKGISDDYIKLVAKNWVEDARFIKNYTTGGDKLTRSTLLKKNYSPTAVEEILKASKSSKKFQKALNAAPKVKTKPPSGVLKTNLFTRVKDGVKNVPVLGKTLKFVKDRVVGGIITKGVLKLLLIGGGAWMAYKWFTDDSIPDGIEEPSDDDLKKTTDWLNCIVNPLKDDTNLGKIGELDNGQLYVDYNIDSFGGVETGGSVRFFDNYTIKTESGKTGKWTCNQSSVKSLQEQEDPQLQMDKDVDQMIDLLDFPVTGSDLQSAHGLLKKYKDSGNGQKFLNLYQGSGYGDGDLRKTLKFVTTTKATSTRLKGEMLGMISSIEGSGKNNAEGNKSDKDSKGGDGNPNTGLSHLTVTWDEKGGGKKGGGTKFSPCSDFPFKLGCISDKIKDIQRCINPTANLKVDGYFGPLTLKAMQDQSKFADTNPNDDIITKEVYDNVMKVCNKKETVKPVTTDTTTREKVKPIEGLKMIDIKPVNSKSLIDKYGVENLIKQRNKRVDGEIVANIIKEKIKLVGGRYKLKMDSELTEDQLKTINLYMAGKGFELLRKKEGLDKSKYVWATDDKTKKRAARKEKAADKKIDKIGNNE